MVVALAEQYRPQGLSVFGVSLDANADMHVVRRFLAEFRPQFPNYRQDPQIDVDEFYHGVNPNWEGSMPETIFYGRDGRIAVHFTAEQTRQTFEQAIHAILGARSSVNRTAPGCSRGQLTAVRRDCATPPLFIGDLQLVFGEELLGIDGRHAAGPCGRNRLPVTMVLHIAGGEHAFDVRFGPSWVMR